MITHKIDMPQPRDVAVILTLCEYGDYLCADLQTAREAQSSDDEAITKMLGSVGPWADALETYMTECKKVVEWSIERHEHGPRPATPMYDYLKQEAERHRISTTELDDRISGFVERKNRYCDNSVQNLVNAKDWKALAEILHTDIAKTWQDKSAQGRSLRVVRSAMHRIKDQWFEWIRPAQSGSGNLDFKVREDAGVEVDRLLEQGKVTFVLKSSGFMEGEAFYLDGFAQGRCSCEIRAEVGQDPARRTVHVKPALDVSGRDTNGAGNSS